MRAGAALAYEIERAQERAQDQVTDVLGVDPWIKAWDALRIRVYVEVRDVAEYALASELARATRELARQRAGRQMHKAFIEGRRRAVDAFDGVLSMRWPVWKQVTQVLGDNSSTGTEIGYLVTVQMLRGTGR